MGRRCVSRGLAQAPTLWPARFEVASVVEVVRISSPTDFNMAFDFGAGGFIQGEHLALAWFLGEPDAEEPLGG